MDKETTKSANTDAAKERFQTIIERFDMAMLVTTTVDGTLRGRPMGVAKIEDDGRVWFITNRHSGKIDDIEARPIVGVTFQSGQRFASLTGRARLVHDAAKATELWSEAWRVWFPEGPDDTSLVLIEVQTSVGEYWDNAAQHGIRYLVDAAKAYFSGTTPETEQADEDPAGHGKVKM